MTCFMQQLQPNTTLQGGKYRIECVLGQGGFGNTYAGYNTFFDEKVAIKEFFMQGLNDRDIESGAVSVSIERNKEQFLEQREKFKKEAQRIRKLNNPHIVKVHDLFEENGTTYYVMDFIDGESLAERLKRTGVPMSEQEVEKILPQILDALKTVHDAGIWHLDLKPANILINKTGNVKLIDFGASKQLNAQKGGATTSTAISYTNGYAPREQMEQNYDKFGPWTDFYALGATLYTLLTNKRPPLPTDIDDDTSEDKHLALPIPSSVSSEMRDLILWLMSTNRNRRPHVVEEITKQLSTRDTDNEQTELLINKGADIEVTNEETIIAPPKIEKSIIEEKRKVKQDNVQTNEPKRKSYLDTDAYKKGGCFTGCIIIAMIAIVLFVIIFSIRDCSNSFSPSPTYVDTDSIEVNLIDSVTLSEFKSSLGKYKYKGQIDDLVGEIKSENSCPEHNRSNLGKADAKGKTRKETGEIYEKSKGHTGQGLYHREDRSPPLRFLYRTFGTGGVRRHLRARASYG